MKPRGFTDEQIVQALRQVGSDTQTVRVCRTHGITPSRTLADGFSLVAA